MAGSVEAPAGSFVETAVEAFVQLEDRSGWLHLTNPVRIITAERAADVRDSLRQVEDAGGSGQYAAGFVRYEAGEAFGLRVRDAPSDLPLVWFALFDPATVHTIEQLPSGASYEVSGLTPSISRPAFARAFERIRTFIADGESYQVNYTWRLRARFRGDALALFADLSAAQRGRHGVFLRTGRGTIASASPELFFSRHGRRITARPMKGTARRGRFPDEDRIQADRLRGSPKERAENVMVVDMIRSDLGRVAEIGSVSVQELFALEPYPNVWQMTSMVTAATAATLDEIFAATFPSASVTGAPKHRTMEIIATLEAEPRGVYTGAVGLVAPGGDARFNVAIRTAVIDEQAGTLDFGVGSGIVWDSDPDNEYEECLLKASVLGRRPRAFRLIETIRWTPTDGFFLIERHLERLVASAEYFGFLCSTSRVADALARAVASSDRPLRVRLILAEDGAVRVEHAPLDLALVQPVEPLRVGLAAAPIDPADVFLFHKTTSRAQYERARALDAPLDDPLDDTVLWNPDRHITESTIANIVVEIDGRRVTPPVECGLLAGTFRAALLAAGEIVESRITIDQLRAAPRFWLVNSVRGWCPAVLAGRRARADL